VRVHIASDHAGFELKSLLVQHLQADAVEVVDHGAETFDPLDNYPPMCLDCAEAVAGDPASLGIVIGGSGNGEQIAANKVQGIRAALAWSEETAILARQHNDANVVSIGARMHTPEEATLIVDAFLATAFSADQRHQHRIDQLTTYEQSGLIDRN